MNVSGPIIIDVGEPVMVIRAAKAEPFQGQTVPDVAIRIEGRPPEFPHGLPTNELLSVSGAFYEADAQAICQALFSALPGGTLDHLVAAIMLRRASAFRVPLEYPSAQAAAAITAALRPFAALSASSWEALPFPERQKLILAARAALEHGA